MPVIELKITLDTTTGQVQASGPLQDRMMCYGLLRMAEEIISAQGQRPTTIDQPRVIPVQVMPPNGRAS